MNNENNNFTLYNQQNSQTNMNLNTQQFNSSQLNQQNIKQQQNNYQGNTALLNIDNSKNKKTIKILIITNVITALLLIGLVVLFILNKFIFKSNEIIDNSNEENKYISTASNEPITNDWKKYKFNINGKTLSLPCSYKEFKSISGFSMKSAYEKSFLERNSSTNASLFLNNSGEEKLALYIDIKNNTKEDLKYSDSEVVNVWQTAYQVETNGATKIKFPGNLEVGMEISKEDIIKLFGEPSDVKTYHNEYGNNIYDSIDISYNNDKVYSSINYYKINLVNNKINELMLDHKKY